MQPAVRKYADIGVRIASQLITPQGSGVDPLWWFAVVKVDPNSPECAKAIAAENTARRQAQAGKANQQLPVLRELYIGRPGQMLPHPDTNATLVEARSHALKNPTALVFIGPPVHGLISW